MTEAFLDRLHAAAQDAAKTETRFRREAALRIEALERERAFAFRRLNLMRSVAEAATRCEDEDRAVEAAREVLCERLGWSGSSETASVVLERFSPVIRAIFAPATSNAGLPELALADFESWYATQYATPFWSLFEQPMAETPRVDF